MNRNFKFIAQLAVSILLFCYFLPFSFAAPLTDWKDGKAYKPKPVLFLHGFNGKPDVWNPAISDLSPLFEKYQAIGPYLEVLDFQDRTGSIDTYPNGDPGWADRLNNQIQDLLSNNKYGAYTQKLNLVAWSMGGLAAREFLTAPKYSSGYVDNLILLGVPNLGSPWPIGAKSLIMTYKIGSMMILPVPILFSAHRNTTNSIARILFIPNLQVLPAIQEMMPGSNFLNTLNNRSQPLEVKYFGIEGVIGNIVNTFLFRDFYGGDGVVSKDSQAGKGYISFQAAIQNISASHLEEPALSVSGDNPLLTFLDSTQPEFEITSPDPSQITEIYEASVHLQGNVYKEYLPADSQLIINVINETDGYTLPIQTSLLTPSDSWIPDNPDSPVAEFDEVINFPGQGTYKISCQIKNPSQAVSEIKEIRVNVVVSESANIVVHCHNPEGKEINSITGISGVAIYDGVTLIGPGAIDGVTHGVSIPISSGTHAIKVEFNGVTLKQEVNLSAGETRGLIFTFERTEVDVPAMLTASGSGSNSARGSCSPPGPGSRSRSRIVAFDGYWTEPVGTSYYELKRVNCVNYAEWWYQGQIDLSWTHNTSYNYTLTPTLFSMHIDSSLALDTPVQLFSPFNDATGYLEFLKVDSFFPGGRNFISWFVQQIAGDYSRDSNILSIQIVEPSRYEGTQITPGYGPLWWNPNGYYVKTIGQVPYSKLKFCGNWNTARFPGFDSSFDFTNEIAAGGLKISSVPYDLTGSAV